MVRALETIGSDDLAERIRRARVALAVAEIQHRTMRGRTGQLTTRVATPRPPLTDR